MAAQTPSADFWEAPVIATFPLEMTVDFGRAEVLWWNCTMPAKGVLTVELVGLEGWEGWSWDTLGIGFQTGKFAGLGRLIPLKNVQDSSEEWGAPRKMSVTPVLESGQRLHISVSRRLTPNSALSYRVRIHHFPPSENLDGNHALAMSGLPATNSIYVLAPTATDTSPVQTWYRWIAPSSGRTYVYGASSVETEIGRPLGLEFHSWDRDFHSFRAEAGMVYLFVVSAHEPWLEGRLFVNPAPPHPPNDDATNAIVLAGNSFVLEGSLLGATGDPQFMGAMAALAAAQDRPSPAAGRDVWWQWTAPAAGELRLGIGEGQLWVRQRGLWREWKSPVDAPGLPVEAGEQLTLVVDARGWIVTSDGQSHPVSAVGPFTVQGVFLPLPTNDRTASAFSLPAESPVTWDADTRAARLEPGSPVAAGLWWRWVAPTNGLAWCHFEPAVGQEYRPMQARWFAGSQPDALRPIEAPMSLYGLNRFPGSFQTFMATAGETYWVWIAAEFPTYQHLELVPAVTNVTAATATRLTGDDIVVFDHNLTEPQHGFLYRWTSPGCGFITLGTNATERVPASAQISGYYELSRHGADGQWSDQETLYPWNPVAWVERGEELLLRVVPPQWANWDYPVGFISYRLQWKPFRPSNDDFGNAHGLNGTAIRLYNATVEPGEPASNSDSATGTVWYSYSDQPGHAFQLNLNGSNLLAEVLTGSGLSSLKRVEVIRTRDAESASDWITHGQAKTWVRVSSEVPVPNCQSVGTISVTHPNPFLGFPLEPRVELPPPGIKAGGELPMQVVFPPDFPVPSRAEFFANGEPVAAATGPFWKVVHPVPSVGWHSIVARWTDGTGAHLKTRETSYYVAARNSDFASRLPLDGTRLGLGWWSWVAPGDGVLEINGWGSSVFDVAGGQLGPALPVHHQETRYRFPVVSGRPYVLHHGRDEAVAVQYVRAPFNDEIGAQFPLEGTVMEIPAPPAPGRLEAGEPGFSAEGCGPLVQSLWWHWTAPTNGWLILGDVPADLCVEMEVWNDDDPTYSELDSSGHRRWAVVAGRRHELRILSGETVPGTTMARLEFEPRAEPLANAVKSAAVDDNYLHITRLVATRHNMVVQTAESLDPGAVWDPIFEQRSNAFDTDDLPKLETTNIQIPRGEGQRFFRVQLYPATDR